MDTPNQNLPIDPGTGSSHDQHTQIDPGTNANHNDTLHAAGTIGGVVAGSVIVDAALHSAAEGISPVVPPALMQGATEYVSNGVQTPMSVPSVVTMAGKVAYETAKIAIPEAVAAAKTFAVETAGIVGRTVAGLVTTADLVAAAQVAVLTLPIAIVGSAVLTTPDPVPVQPTNLDPSYGVTHTENMSIQPAAAHEVSIDPGADPHQANMSVDNSQHDTNDQKISIDPAAHDNQSSDPNISIDPGVHDNHQSGDQHMSVDPGTSDNHQSYDQSVSIDSNISNDQNNHHDSSN